MGKAAKVKSLFDDLKNELDITWEDPDGDRKLEGILRRGIAYVRRLSPRELGFEEGTKERELLFNYCRYARDGATGEFAENYLTEILTFQSDEAIRRHREEKENEKNKDTGIQ